MLEVTSWGHVMKDPKFYTNPLLTRNSRAKIGRTVKYLGEAARRASGPRISELYRPNFIKTVWVILTVAHPKTYDSSFLRVPFYHVVNYHAGKIFSFGSLSIKSLFISAFWANFRLRIRANFGLSFSHFRWIHYLESSKRWLIIQ